MNEMISNVKVNHSKQIKKIFGTFLLGESEFGIDVKEILEVVNLPENIIPIPLSPQFVIGVFNLRGMIIPILDMSILLKTPSKNSATKKIVILSHNNIKFGLIFDSTSEILRVEESDINIIAYSNHGEEILASSLEGNIVTGVLKLAEGKRLVQIIQTSEIAKVENLPHVLERLKITSIEENKVKSSYTHNQCISFKVGSYLLALDVNAISEIIEMPQYQKTPLSTDLCLGLATLRGMIVPLIHFSKLLESDSVVDTHFNTKKVIVMALGDEHFGLIIDEVENIMSYSEEELIPVPVFSKDRAKLILGCIAKIKSPEVLLINHSKILSDQEISAITHGHNNIYKTQETLSLKNHKKTSKKNSYITFHLEHYAALPILDIQEIIVFPKEISHTPGTPDFIRGIFNLRGKLVSIIDLRKTYHLPALPDEVTSKVLIVHTQNEILGLMVDSVDGLITIDEDQKLAIPTLLQPKTSSHLQIDIKEYIETKDDSSSPKSTMIFDLNAILKRVQKDIAA